jgi:hypothetical protein
MQQLGMKAQTCTPSTARNEITAAIRTLVKQNYALSGRWTDDDGGVLISAGVQKGYEGVAKRLLQELPAYRNRFSFADIANRLRSLVTDIVRGGSESEEEALIGRFWDRLENQDERKVCYVPLDGLKLSTPRVEIGRFNLRRMDDNAIAEAVSLMEASVENTLNSLDCKEAFKKLQAEEIRKELQDTVCLLVSVNCDIQKADQTAVRDALLLIDLLRFVLPVDNNADVIGVGLKGDSRAARYTRYILPLGRSDGSFRSYWRGPMGGANVDDKLIATMEARGVMKLISRLGGQLSALEKALLRAIHWFAESEIQNTVDYKLVTLIIAVEALFELEQSSRGKTNAICESTAVLLRDNDAGRKAVFLLMRDACFFRGEVVHQGDDAAEYLEIKKLRQTVHSLIAVVCNRAAEFSTSKDVLGWVGQQSAKLSQRAHWKEPQMRLTGSRPYHRRSTQHGRIEDGLS